MKIFNPDFSGMSTEELQDLIEHADLPSLGYKKVTEKKTEIDFETGWFLDPFFCHIALQGLFNI